MKFNVTDVENSQKMIEVELPFELYNEAFEKQLNKILPTVKMPGFRPGKAPKEKVAKEYKHKISVQALEDLIHEAIDRTVRESGVVPLNIPMVKDVVFEEDKPITFKIYVDVYPSVNLTKYKGFDFEREVRVITDEDVEEVLENLRNNYVTYEPAEEGSIVENGDRVIIDFEGKKDGVPFDGGTAQDYSLDIGSKRFIEGFEEGIIGMKKGETKDLVLKFPEDYGSKDLAGQEVVFTVTVKEIKKKKLPELNDDFASMVDPEMDSIEKLRESIKKDLIENAEFYTKENFYDKMLEKLIEENTFELPNSMIDEQSRSLADRAIKNYCRSYGIDPKALNLDPDKIKDQYREAAIKQTKGAIILNALAELENITVTDEDVDAKIAEYAEAIKMTPEEYKEMVQKNGTINNIKNNVLVDKLYDFLCSVNNVTDKTVTLKELKEREKNNEAQ
ncbi:MAG: trigger factor [Deferribacterales bacterium]